MVPVRLLSTGGGSVTVRVAVSETPSTVALIVVEPSSTPVAVVADPDDGLTVATEVLLLDQAKDLPVISVLSAVKALAVNRCVSPSSIEAEGGLTVTVATTGAGSVTVSVAVSDTPSTVALMVVMPASLAVARPEELTVATSVSVLDHVKVLPVITVPSDSRALAENRCVSPSSIEAEDGLTVTIATTGGGSSTVRVAVPFTPPAEALMVVMPASFAVARPEELMVATDVLLLDQVNEVPDISVLSAVKAVAENCFVSPSSMVAEAGLTVMELTTGGGSSTVREADPDTPPAAALMVVVPAFRPVARPEELMVATVVELLDQVKDVLDISVLSAVKALAENCFVSPSSMVAEAGLTVMELTTGGGSSTVREADPDTPPAAALMVVVPAFRPVARPEELTVATEVLLLDQVKDVPDISVLSAVKALAENCFVSPSSMVAEAGLTVMELTTGGGSSTVREADPDTPPAAALMVVVPAFRPVARPEELTVATEVLLLDQVKDVPGISVPSSVNAVARNRRVPPSSMVAEAGLTVMEWTTGGGSSTVREAVPDTPSVVAVMVVEPASTPLANPDALIVATVSSELVQVKILPVISTSFAS